MKLKFKQQESEFERRIRIAVCGTDAEQRALERLQKQEKLDWAKQVGTVNHKLFLKMDLGTQLDQLEAEEILIQRLAVSPFAKWQKLSRKQKANHWYTKHVHKPVTEEEYEANEAYDAKMKAKYEAEKKNHEEDIDNVKPTFMRPCSPAEILSWPASTTQVETLFLPGAFVICAGAPKSGKTTLSADMLCSIQCGEPWQIGDQKLEVQQGQVVYITKEGKGGWQARMAALQMKYGHHEAFNDMKWFFEAPMLDTEEGKQFLLRSIDALEVTPTIIVYDNLSRLMTGDENTVQATAPVIQTLDTVRDRYGCTNFLLHHAGWKQAARLRGSSNLAAAADTVIVLEKKSSVLQSDLITKLSTKMQRDLPPITPMKIHFRSVEVGVDENGKNITALVAHHQETQAEIYGKKILKRLSEQSTLSIRGTRNLGNVAGLSIKKTRSGLEWLVRTGKVQKKKTGIHVKWTKITDVAHD